MAEFGKKPNWFNLISWALAPAALLVAACAEELTATELAAALRSLPPLPQPNSKPERLAIASPAIKRVGVHKAIEILHYLTGPPRGPIAVVVVVINGASLLFLSSRANNARQKTTRRAEVYAPFSAENPKWVQCQGSLEMKRGEIKCLELSLQKEW